MCVHVLLQSLDWTKCALQRCLHNCNQISAGSSASAKRGGLTQAAAIELMVVHSNLALQLLQVKQHVEAHQAASSAQRLSAATTLPAQHPWRQKVERVVRASTEMVQLQERLSNSHRKALRMALRIHL